MPKIKWNCTDIYLLSVLNGYSMKTYCTVYMRLSLQFGFFRFLSLFTNQALDFGK